MSENTIWSHLKNNGLVIKYHQENDNAELCITFPEKAPTTENQSEIRALMGDVFAKLSPVGVVSHPVTNTSGVKVIMNFIGQAKSEAAAQYARHLSRKYNSVALQERKNREEAKKCMTCWGSTRSKFKLPKPAFA